MRSSTFLSAGVALALASHALAQDTQPAATPAAPAVSAQPASPDAPGQRGDWRGTRREGLSIEGMVQRLDTNGDGVVNVSELADNPRAQRWAEADANGDGILASGEIDAVRQSWRAQRGEGQRRGGRRGQSTQAAPATPEN
jgi:hypothetical protein